MTNPNLIIDALKAVCADLEAHSPNAPSLHYAKGLLAAGVTMPVEPAFVGRAGLPAQEIIDKWKAGKNGIELGAEYGVSSETIYRLLGRYGYNGRGRPRGPKKKYVAIADEAAALYQSGLSLLDVAAKLNVSVGTVASALSITNTPQRDKGPRKVEDHSERAEHMLSMRAAGHTFEEIGAHYSITRERVRQILKAAGKWDEAQERVLRPEEIAAANEYADGATIQYVASKLGVSVHRAKTIIAKAGVVLRPTPRQTSDRVRERADKAAVLYGSGARVVDIAREIGINAPEGVYRLLALKGIKPSRLPRRAA